MLKKLLAFSAVVEIATAFAVMIDPRLVVALLLGGDIAGIGIPVARCFGIALVALGLACWPGRQSTVNVAAAVRGMQLYNAAIAAYLAYIGTVDHLGGPLLWPAVVLHAVVAALLATTWWREGNTAAIES